MTQEEIKIREVVKYLIKNDTDYTGHDGLTGREKRQILRGVKTAYDVFKTHWKADNQKPFPTQKEIDDLWGDIVKTEYLSDKQQAEQTKQLKDAKERLITKLNDKVSDFEKTPIEANISGKFVSLYPDDKTTSYILSLVEDIRNETESGGTVESVTLYNREGVTPVDLTLLQFRNVVKQFVKKVRQKNELEKSKLYEIKSATTLNELQQISGVI